MYLLLFGLLCSVLIENRSLNKSAHAASVPSKMNRLKTFVTPTLVIGALLMGALAVAQDGGQGRMRRGGFGGGRQGSSLMLLRRSDVQADLKLTAEQKTKLDEVMKSMRGERSEGGQRRNRGEEGSTQQRTPPTDAERQARREAAESRQAELQKNINSVLSNDQVERLTEISLQLRGYTALLDQSVQKDLGFTDDQKAKVKSLREKMGEASQSIFQKVQDNSITREEAMKSMQKNNDVMKEELSKVLSKSQADKFKSMQGSTFKADPSESQRQFGFGGGRRQRGGGGSNGGGK
jgi:hypothetical protein